MNFRIAISKSHLSKLVVAFVSILLFEFLIRDYAVLLMSNVRTEGSFAPASPHKASTGSGSSADIKHYFEHEAYPSSCNKPTSVDSFSFKSVPLNLFSIRSWHQPRPVSQSYRCFKLSKLDPHSESASPKEKND